MNFIKFNNQLINLEHVSRIHTEEIIDLYADRNFGEDPIIEEYQIVISFTNNSYKNSLKFSFKSEEQRTASFNLLKSLIVKDI